MEAMPPLPLAPPYMKQRWEQSALLDASKRHPVFFTDRLKKAPAGVCAGGAAWVSPVAVGYVFNDGVRRDGGVKL